MKVKVLAQFPPNIKRIAKAFPLSGGEIFAWDGIIYNPNRGHLSKALIAHEKVHFKQGHPVEWWDCYIASPAFRLEMETEAHIEEYRVFCRGEPNTDKRKNYLTQIARRLSAPMYGDIISYTQAKKRILDGQ